MSCFDLVISTRRDTHESDQVIALTICFLNPFSQNNCLGFIRGVYGIMPKTSFTLSNCRIVIRDKYYKRYLVL